jgi:hypothetical protein
MEHTMTSKNRTHTTRAARALQRAAGITYSAALAAIHAAGAAPRPEVFDDPAFTASFVERHLRPAAAATPTLPVLPPSMLAMSFEVTITDDIGHTVDRWTAQDLHADMVAAIAADPSARSWSSPTWTVTVPAAASEPVFADRHGSFVLADGSTGNPGCDGCGMSDAVVRIDGVYMCVDAAIEAGLEPWTCDECDRRIVSAEHQSPQHAPTCSLHPDNEVTVEAEVDDEDPCDRCGAALDDGEGYDGLCGNCADIAESTCSVCGGDVVDDPSGSPGVLVHDPDADAPPGWDSMVGADLDADHVPHTAWD